MDYSSVKHILAKHSPLVILAGLCVVLALISDDFRSVGNLQKVSLRTCVVAVMALGQILVIITAGIDLSVASVAALSGMVAGVLMTKHGLPAPLGIAVGVGVGCFCGSINGLLITKGRIPPFIVTLGMMMVARGAAFLVTDSQNLYGLPETFRYIGGTMKINDSPTWWIPVVITILLVIFFATLLAQTRFGRALYATGGNLTGARLSGISVDRVRLQAYMLSGSLAGFSGLLIAARVGSAAPSAAMTYELDAIAACVIGGASLMGGEGGALGVLAGALVMIVLVNFCNLNDISSEWQKVLVGSLIIALVYYDSARKRRAGLLND